MQSRPPRYLVAAQNKDPAKLALARDFRKKPTSEEAIMWQALRGILLALGLRVERFTNEEVRTSLASVLRRIGEVARRGQAPAPFSLLGERAGDRGSPATEAMGRLDAAIANLRDHNVCSQAWSAPSSARRS